MASGGQNQGSTAPRCFKHDKKWQPRIQQLLNKFRNSLIPKIYLGRLNNLLCICGTANAVSRPNIGNVWEEVSDEKLAQSANFIDNHISTNIGNENVPMLKKIMDWLRKDKEISAENSADPHPNPRSSALKLLYILQKVIEKDFSILEPRKLKGAVQQSKKKEKSEMIQTFILEDYKPELLGQLVGFCGRNIMTFMKREKCHVRFEKFNTVSGVEKVKATIKKTIDNMSELDRIAGELKDFAKETQDTVESYVPSDDEEEITPEVLSVYDEVDQMNQVELKEEYKELLEAIDTLGPNSKFQEVGAYFQENSSIRYRAITRKMPIVNQIQAFNDYISKLVSQAVPKSPSVNIASLSIGQSLSSGPRYPASASSTPKTVESTTGASSTPKTVESSTGASSTPKTVESTASQVSKTDQGEPKPKKSKISQ